MGAQRGRTVRLRAPRLCVWVIAAALAATMGCSDERHDAGPVPPGAGIGDPYYPTDGNRGYDVASYDVRLTFEPAPARITATDLVTATATRRLTGFDLDLDPRLTVSSVLVDGRPAAHRRAGEHELVVRPVRTVDPHRPFTVRVAYHGELGSSGPISGWQPLPSGGGVIAGEPHSCAFWYPCNDHPTDKAAFRLTATVPAGMSVISNGLQGPSTPGTTDGAATTTFRWHLDTPTATYLTTMLVDRLTVRRSRLPDGTPVVDAYSPGALGEASNEAKLPAILALLASRFGPYPAPAAGGLFVDSDVGFSLETFTRPIYTAKVPLATIVHENAHQWWGDNVSVRRWRDVCFNECMASYAQWLWREHEGQDLDAYYRRTVNRVDFSAPLYDMGPGHEFDYSGVYVKGAYFEHALRRKIGDDATYFHALQGIQRDFAGGNMSMTQFRDELGSRTGVDLRAFWRDWVLSTHRPSPADLFPGTLAHP